MNTQQFRNLYSTDAARFFASIKEVNMEEHLTLLYDYIFNDLTENGGIQSVGLLLSWDILQTDQRITCGLLYATQPHGQLKAARWALIEDIKLDIPNPIPALKKKLNEA